MSRASDAGAVSFSLTLPPGVNLPSDAMMVWKWGDGSQTDPVPLPFTGPGPATFSTGHQYSAPGDYAAQLVIYNLASSVTVPVSVCTAHTYCISLSFNLHCTTAGRNGLAVTYMTAVCEVLGP